jgi:hypothetical protein
MLVVLDYPLALTLDPNVPLEVYEARNAVEIAKSRGADKYAPEIFSKAEGSLKLTENSLASRAEKNAVISTARQTAQFSEDARLLTAQRRERNASRRSRRKLPRKPRLKLKPRPPRTPLKPSAKRMPTPLKPSAKRMRKSLPRNKLGGLLSATSSNCVPACSNSSVASCPRRTRLAAWSSTWATYYLILANRIFGPELGRPCLNSPGSCSTIPLST